MCCTYFGGDIRKKFRELIELPPKFAGIIATNKRKSGSVQDLIDDVEIGSGLWLADEESSDDEDDCSGHGGGGGGRPVLLIEGDPV